MARDKNQRELNFKPLFKKFGQNEIENNNEIALLHEEIEAIYLIDLLGLYQEEAAQKMNVSRPTLSRIIRNARHKVANSLIGGAKLHIHDQKDSYTLAVCSDDEDELINSTSQGKYILIFEIKEKTYKQLKSLENPVFFKKQKPGMVLPKLLLENNVNFFLANEIGAGLKNSLLSKGIYTILKKKIKFDDLSNIPI
ncbi:MULTISPECIES: DUF134 domain-containing protein [Malaciobacter]|jgi:predicted DNA-binding protein (UPF0251 family)/predicted Fe-Mo cluster-binding NifX family protein|uniref:DNA-binding protein (UPF0251 family) n=2 Tax=Malaciobacter TaxID=2321114 RepID=A0AB36ZS49_9BACT|nr:MULTISPECIES: DUF134 domain-containing protein [Malaciobacter]PHO10060.1 DNA-binding protein [Malaciobacter canalis]PPK57485.1 putative DNA-binding protein (UPF0251 family) [Malaciobacter marinus]QEE33642.1 putative DNA-binding protein (DUF134 domain) [Malaciobacter canalis]